MAVAVIPDLMADRLVGHASDGRPEGELAANVPLNDTRSGEAMAVSY